MYKYILFFLFIHSINVMAQKPTLPKGLPSPNNVSYYKIGYMRSDSGLLLGFRDTSFYPISGVGAIVSWNNRYWKWDLDSLKWNELSSGVDFSLYLKKVDSSIYTTTTKTISDSILLRGLINNKINTYDTSNMLSGYVRNQRLIDSISSIQLKLNQKLFISDTAAMLAGYVKTQRFLDSILSVKNYGVLSINTYGGISSSASVGNINLGVDTTSRNYGIPNFGRSIYLSDSLLKKSQTDSSNIYIRNNSLIDQAASFRINGSGSILGGVTISLNSANANPVTSIYNLSNVSTGDLLRLYNEATIAVKFSKAGTLSLNNINNINNVNVGAIGLNSSGVAFTRNSADGFTVSRSVNTNSGFSGNLFQTENMSDTFFINKFNGQIVSKSRSTVASGATSVAMDLSPSFVTSSTNTMIYGAYFRTPTISGTAPLFSNIYSFRAFGRTIFDSLITSGSSIVLNGLVNGNISSDTGLLAVGASNLVNKINKNAALDMLGVVSLTRNESIAGKKIFTDSLTVNGISTYNNTIRYINTPSAALNDTAFLLRNTNSGNLVLSTTVNAKNILGISSLTNPLSGNTLTDTVFLMQTPAGITVKLTKSEVRSLVFDPIINTTSASTLSMTLGFTDYLFNGTTTTWTLPPLTNNKRLFIYNTGSGNITLNSNGGTNTIWAGGVITNTTTVAPNESYRLLCNGTYWILTN